MRAARPWKPALAAVTLVAVALTGCSTTTADDEAQAGAEDRGTVDKILIDYPWTALPIYGVIVSILEERAAELGVELVFTNDEMDLQKQVSQLNTYLSSDVDAVVSFPVDPASLEGIAEQYRDAGKYWVSYAEPMENQDAGIQFGFYESGYQLGVDAGTWALENVGPDAEVLVLNEQTRYSGQERTRGIMEGLEETAPDLQIVAEQQAITPDDGLTVTTTVLAQHPNVNLVLAAIGDVAQGSYQALIASGRSATDDQTYVGGLDQNLFALEKMRDGDFMRGFTYISITDLVSEMLEVPIALGEGETDASVDLPVKLITVDDPDLDTYITQLGG